MKKRKRAPQTVERAVGSLPPISVPYFAPERVLPASLPTTTNIQNTQEILLKRTGAKVVAVGPYFVVKYGKNIDLEEGRTMKYVEDCSTVPVPRLYALYHENEENYIVMERIHGKTLQEEWQTLTDTDKCTFALQLKTYLQDLRAIPSPGGYCSLDNKPLRDTMFWTGWGDESKGYDGPFNSGSQLVAAIIKKCEASEALKGKASFYKGNLPSIFSNHPPTFSHDDLQRKNVMVRSESRTLVLLDWECAGWYPAFWEYARTVCGCRLFDDDWHMFIPKFLKNYHCEYAWFQMLWTEIGW